MIYNKYEIDERTTVTNELHEDELFTYCGDCDKEMPVELKDIVDIYHSEGDFGSTIFYCSDCTNKKRRHL